MGFHDAMQARAGPSHPARRYDPDRGAPLYLGAYYAAVSRLAQTAVPCFGLCAVVPHDGSGSSAAFGRGLQVGQELDAEGP